MNKLPSDPRLPNATDPLTRSSVAQKYELIFNGDMSISGFDLVMSPDGSE